MRRRRAWTIAALSFTAAGILACCWQLRTSSKVLANGVIRLDIRFEGAHLTAVKVDPHVAGIDLVWKRPDGSRIETLQGALRQRCNEGWKPIFATNAGIFTVDRVPLGLHVEDGFEAVPLNRHNGDGNFYIRPNGVFWIDADGPHVIGTEHYAPSKPVHMAVQSGPLLVQRGQLNNAFKSDSQNLRTRSGVGIDSSGYVVFLLSENKLSFDRFARCFHDALHCADALYLDGTVSRFCFAGGSDGRQSSDFAAMFVVSIKPTAPIQPPAR